MKGQEEVIDLLNEVLTAELTAINQYFIHAKMCQNWGFEALYQYVRKESIDEMKHADAVISRILFLDGLPNLQRLSKLRIGQTVKEQLEADKQLEVDAIDRLNKAIAVAVRLGDNGSRDLLEKILVSEEEHLDWLEAQLHLMATIGEANYLAQQIRS